MANENIISSVAGLITSEVLSAEVLMLLADRDASVLGHPAILHATAAASTSLVVQVPHIGLGGYDLLSPVTEANEVANTQITDGSTDVAIAMRAKRYTTSDLAGYVTQGKIGAAALARDLVASVGQTLISLIAIAGSGYTAQAGPGTGVNLTWASFLAGKGKLSGAEANGPMLAVLHKQQWTDLEADALALGYAPSIEGSGVLTLGLEQYKGNWFGIDIFVSKHVPTVNAGADRGGCLIAPGAVAWANAPIDADGADLVAEFGTAKLERARQGTFLQTAYIFSHAAGVSRAIDAAGVTIVSDA